MKRFITLLIIAMLMLSIGASAAVTNKNYSFTDEQRITPFWLLDTVYNEYVSFVETGEGIFGTTLFVPTEIVCVVDSALQTEYYPDVDFKWIEGTNRIEWLEGSSIPYFYSGALDGKVSPDSDELVPTSAAEADEQGRYRIGETLVCESSFLYSRQFCVTYKYDRAQISEQSIRYTEYQGDKLPITESKLKNGDDLNVLFYGDSIFEGCSASSFGKREPYMPSLSKLIRAELQSRTTGTVTLDNISVGGWASGNGLNALQGPGERYDLSSSYQGYDLLILSFGMNDVWTDLTVFGNNTSAIVSLIREANPDIEVILVSCMCPNSTSVYYGNQQYQGAILSAMAANDAHTAFVDMFSVHASILNYKSFISTSGNNINHPNDWLIRVYAQNILSAILQYKTQPDSGSLNLFQRIIQYIQNLILWIKNIFVSI